MISINLHNESDIEVDDDSIRELVALVFSANGHQSAMVDIIITDDNTLRLMKKEHFNQDTELAKEMELYKALHRSDGMDPYTGEKLIQEVKLEAANELAKTDWYVVRKSEESTAIPSAITTHRRLVRTKAAAMETSITNASDTPALETLYAYTTDSDGVQSRPLGELPTLD